MFIIDSRVRSTEQALRLLAAVAVAVALLIIPGTSPATAVGVSVVEGRPGAVVVNGAQIVGYETLQPYGGYRMFSSGGVTVYRSPMTTGRQTIVARYQIEQAVNGQWTVLATGPVHHGVVSRYNRSVRMPAWNWVPTRDATMQAGYRISYLIGWSDSSGRVIAGEWVFPNRVGEGRCMTTQRRCIETDYGIFF